MPAEFDLRRPRRVHVVAVGGAGMSSIALLLAQGGHRVSGSDEVERPTLDALRRAGVTVHLGHEAAHVRGAELVVASTAVADDNVELAEARSLGIPVRRRREFLPAFAALQPFLSVTGTHGKTTTASMLAVAARAAGTDPSWLLGAPVPVLGGSAALGRGPWMVLEADESDGSFLAGPRAGAVLTNAEADHLEFWGGWAELRAGFARFISGTEGPVVACADDEGAAALAAEARVATYGVTGEPYRVRSLELSRQGSSFELDAGGRALRVEVGLPGRHNALNAAGALALLGELGVDLEPAAEGLAAHRGLYRRFERRGSAGGVEVVDDYAHLPTEVRAALAAGADSGWERLVVVFQPHRYSRTEALWEAFGPAFSAADVLVLTDVYPAGEAPRPGVDGRLIVKAARDAGADPRWAPTLAEAAEAVMAELREGDLLMTVGAGDVRDVGDMVLERLGAGGGR